MDARIPEVLNSAATLEGMGDGFVAIDRQWHFTYVNARAAQIQGCTAESLIGRSLFEVYPEAIGTDFETAYRKVMVERVPVQFEAYYPPRGRWLDQRIFPTPDGIGIFLADVTDRRRIEQLSAGQHRLLESIAGDAPLHETLDGIVRLIEGDSPELLGSILLLDDERLHLCDGAAPSLPADYLQAIYREPIGPAAGTCGTAAYLGVEVISEDIETDALWEKYRSIARPYGLRAAWSTPIFDPQHRVVGTFALYFHEKARPSDHHRRLIEIATHIAAIAIVKARVARERAHEQASLRNSESTFRSVFVNAAIGMTMVDMEERLLQVNPAFAEMIGYTDDELRGRRFSDISHTADLAEELRLYRSLVAGERTNFQIDKRYVRKNGSAMWGRVTVSLIPQEGNTPPFTIGMIEDITARKLAEERVEFLATHDGLTELPNRNLIHDRITQALGHARRAVRQIAVLYLDLDRFKVINDFFGHAFGDAVLQLVGKRLTAVVRSDDTVARQSGDEFLILLSDLRKPTDVYIVAQKLLDAFAAPLILEEREVHVSASIGISVYPHDGESADMLISNSDVAMYHAKNLGSNTYQFFTREMSELTRCQVELETGLRLAILHDQLHLVYQPKVNLADGRITGCEALLRWNHPELGAIPPSQFIPIAEESGQIVSIGDWVLRTACSQNKEWLDAGLPPVVVSVNISARQFLQQDVFAWVMATLQKTALPPELLELELTETLIAQDIDKVTNATNQLKFAGVKISIDDFGTGYSNLRNLKRYQVDTLKIDQSFVRDMLTDSDDATIAKAIISLAHSLRMRVIAEGVETAQHCAMLRRENCDEIQGYFFSKPVPAAELAEMLRADRRLATA